MPKVDYVLQNANDNERDNIVQSFQLESTSLRGRVVRMGSVLDEILAPHNYPEPVALLLGEAATLAVLLSSMMKYDGIFTLQAQGDGPVSMVIADVTSSGDVRACATFREGALEKIKRADVPQTAAEIMGKGYLAFTVDQGAYAERYQGIVELSSEGLLRSIRAYFTQSEQIGTGIRVAIKRDAAGFRAGAVMLQHMPEDDKRSDRPDGAFAEDWNRSNVLLESCQDSELTSRTLLANDLLYRLFHEEGVRVFKPQCLRKGCRCTPQKLERVLAMMSKDDRAYMTVDGQIVMHCEFCNRDFGFDPDQVGTAPEGPETIN